MARTKPGGGRVCLPRWRHGEGGPEFPRGHLRHGVLIAPGRLSAERQPPSYMRAGLSNRCPTRCCLVGGPAVPPPGPPVPVVALAVGVAAVAVGVAAVAVGVAAVAVGVAAAGSF